MYASLSNRLLATVVVFGLLLQGCRSNFRVTFEEPVFKKSRKTGDDAPIPHQVSVLDVPSSVLSDVPSSELPTVASATLLSMAVSLMHYLAVGNDTVSIWEQASSTESEETDNKACCQAYCSGSRISFSGSPSIVTRIAILSHYPSFWGAGMDSILRGGRSRAPSALDPGTWTRCQDLVAWRGSHYPVVGDFSSGGSMSSAAALTTTATASAWLVSGSFSIGYLDIWFF